MQDEERRFCQTALTDKKGINTSKYLPQNPIFHLHQQQASEQSTTPIKTTLFFSIPQHQPNSFKMKLIAIVCTLMAAASVSASNIQARDTCGAGYGGDQRRTNSDCASSNGDRHFCGCDRTGIVRLRYCV